ncbi:conserved hypothetical protein, partial [Neospora caninum Liverpool]
MRCALWCFWCAFICSIINAFPVFRVVSGAAAPTMLTRISSTTRGRVRGSNVGSMEKADGNSMRNLADVTRLSGPDNRTRQVQSFVYMDAANPHSSSTSPGGDVLNSREAWTTEVIENDKQAGHPSKKNNSFQQVHNMIENVFLLEEAQSVRLDNDWRLIEESWQMVELFQKEPAKYLASGFHLKVDEDGRLIATTTLPFWKVDLAGTMRSVAAVAVRQQLGMNLQRRRPFRITARNGGIEIGYTPLPRRAAVSVGYRDTTVTVSAGRPQLIRIPVADGKAGFDT